MLEPNVLLRGILAPGLLTGALLLILWGLASSASRRDVAASPSAAAFAVPAGMLLGWVLLFGWKNRPAESWQWLGWVIAITAVLGAVDASEKTPPAARWGLRIAMVAAVLGLLLRKRLWPAGGDLAIPKLALYATVPLLTIALWRSAIPRLGALAGATTLWLFATATAAMVLFAGFGKFAQAAGALAGALGALVVACWLRPSTSGMAGAIVPVAVLLSGLSFVSLELSYADYSPWLFAVPALAPLVAFQPLVRRPWPRVALLAAALAVAVGLAYRSYDPAG